MRYFDYFFHKSLHNLVCLLLFLSLAEEREDDQAIMRNNGNIEKEQSSIEYGVVDLVMSELV